MDYYWSGLPCILSSEAYPSFREGTGITQAGPTLGNQLVQSKAEMTLTRMLANFLWDWYMWTETLFLCRDCTPEDRRWSCLRQSVPCQKGKGSQQQKRMRAIHRGKERAEGGKEREEEKLGRGGGQKGRAYWHYCLRLNPSLSLEQNLLWGFPVSINYHFSPCGCTCWAPPGTECWVLVPWSGVNLGP